MGWRLEKRCVLEVKMMKWFKRIALFLAIIGVPSVLMAATVTSQLDDGRMILFDDYYLTNDAPPTWVHEGTGVANTTTTGLLPGTNHYHRTGWVLQNSRIGQWTGAGRFYVPPQMAMNYIPTVATTNYSANLMNTLNAAIYSPVFSNGIGTLYFEVINGSYQSAYAPRIALDIATNMVSGVGLSGNMMDPNVNWQNVFTNEVSKQSINDFARVIQELDIRQPVAFRIRRVNVNGPIAESLYISVDNIRVSPSAPDIEFSDISAVVDGGGTSVECVVGNAPGTAARTDHTSREIELRYRWFSPADETQGWSSTPMFYQAATGTDGDGEVWATGVGAILFQPGMVLEYYFVFSGGTVYQSPDYTEQGYGYDIEAGARYPQDETLTQTGEEVEVTVSFAAQGGTVSPSSRDYVVGWNYGNAGGLPTPAYLGYTFDGWFADAGYTGDAITNATIVLESIVTLYAKWTPITYVVSYHANGGTGTMADSTFTYGVEETLSPNAFGREGYSFWGWTTNTAWASVVYTNNASVSNLLVVQGATYNLHVLWTGNIYTVTFNTQGGGPAVPETKNVVFGGAYGVPLPTPSRPGYAFQGWYTEPGGQGSLITAVTPPVSIPSDHTLFARWTPLSYAVTFDSDGGSAASGITVTYDTPYGPLPAPTKFGFLFTGWFTAPAGGGVQVTASTLYSPATPMAHTLYANWVSNIAWYTTNTTAVTYLLTTDEELNGFSILVNMGMPFSGKTVILGADIDMSSLAPWTPIGTNDATMFLGTFDGHGKVISGVTVHSTASDDVGLFGVVGYSGIIRNVNLTLTDCTLSGQANVGGVAGRNLGSVQNCQVLGGTVTGISNVGGLVGQNDGLIRNSFSTALVNTGSPRGGLAGLNSGTIQYAYWLADSAAAAIGTESGTTNNVYSFTGFPGTLNGTAFDTQVLSGALNAWVQAQNGPFYWWTDGTEDSPPLLTIIAPPQETTELTENRILLFDDYYLTNNLPSPTWVHQGTGLANTTTTGLLPGTNHYHRTGWVLLSCRMGQWTGAGRFSIPPEMAMNYIPTVATTNYSANLMNTLNAAIYSPIFQDGIGTVYFEAINGSYQAAYTNQIALDVAIDMKDGSPLFGSMTDSNVNWQNIFTNSLAGQTMDEFVRVVEKLDIRQPVAFRIRRTNTSVSPIVDSVYTCVDNIRVSFPPADIVLSKPLAPFDIGYPSVNTPGGKMLCQIDNIPGPFLTSYPGGTRTNVQVVTRWNYIQGIANPPAGWVTPWQTNTLSCVHTGDGFGEGELWEGVFPQYPDAGSLEYYFRAAYNGAYYRSPDYTERGYAYPPERTSPKIYSESGTVGTPFKFDIRLYPAVFGEVIAVTDQFGEVPMYLSGTNEWQARIEIVNHPSVSNITWYFVGSGEYLGNYTYSDSTVYWCNATTVQDGTLPYGDNCLFTDNPDLAMKTENRFGVKVLPEESNYVLLTLNTSMTNFVAGRGEYQNFNKWNGADVKFTHTLDKYPKTRYEQDFADWTITLPRGVSNHWGSLSITNQVNVPHLAPIVDQNASWGDIGSFEYVVERTQVIGQPEAPALTTWYNQAIRLFGGSPYLGLGYFQGNENQIDPTYGARGVGTVSFRARLSRLVKNNSSYCIEPAIYNKGYTNNNYMVEISLNGVVLSPESPSVSVLVYYQSPNAFYEYRVTQVITLGSPPGADTQTRHALYKWQNGVATPLSTNTVVSGFTLTSANTVVLGVFTEPGGAVRFSGFYSDVNTPRFSYRDVSPICLSGTFGVLSSECSFSLNSLNVYRTSQGAGDSVVRGTQIMALTSLSPGDWALSPSYRPTGASSFTTSVLTNSIQVLLRDGASPQAPWRHHQTLSVSSFAYQTFSVAVNACEDTCVRLQVGGTPPGTLGSDIVLDSIGISSWRGESSNRDGWRVVNAWVATNATPPLRFVRMDASQASPTVAQSVQSPQIMGLGSISFDYRVLDAPAQLRIQYSDNLDPLENSLSSEIWKDLSTNSVITRPSATGWQTFSEYYGEFPTTNLFFRILNDRSGAFANSRVEISNITIVNNPTNSPNDWIAYNAKISGLESSRWWLDAGWENPARSLFLNNLPNTDTDDNLSFFDPYVMSPKLLKGLGRISFLARAYEPAVAASGAPVTVSAWATTNAWSANTLGYHWEKVHTFTLHTNAFYRPYSISPTNATEARKYTAVKLVVDGGSANAPGPQRVCLDEILVSEQIYAKFDISNVRLLRAPDDPTQQPMEGEDIGVEARLTNFLLNPTDIVVRVYYVIGTNTWGVFTGPDVVKREMFLVGDPQDRVYRTAEPFITGGIEEQIRNTVVQYKVCAEYREAGKTDLFQVEQEPNTFVNPPWYYPIDLNKRFAASAAVGWSPYFIVYDVPPGAIWINEVNRVEDLVYTPVPLRDPYIEIAVPGWMDLNGWSIECLSGEAVLPTTASLPITSDAVSKNLDAASGYAFYMIGTSALPQTDYTVNNLTTYMPSVRPGALRLIRPTGIHEQTVVYDWDPVWINNPNGQMWANAVTNGEAHYIGYDANSGSLSFTGTVSDAGSRFLREDSTNTWVSGYNNYNWTPGAPNEGQGAFPNAPPPSGLNVLVTSTMSPTNGTQNGFSGEKYLLRVRKGGSTNIIYRANRWYRLYSIKVNSIEALTSAPTNEFTLALNNLQSGANVLASLDLREDIPAGDYPQGFKEWLDQFDDKPLAPTYLNVPETGKQLSLLERYWIDANPTTTNLFTFRAHQGPEFEDKLLHLYLEMMLNSNRIDRLQGGSVVKVMTSFSLSPINWTLLSQFVLGDDSFDEANRSRIRFFAFPYDQAFFTWRLDWEDPRSSTFLMLNRPKP